MAKRIVSGIFILTALGALGVILAGAMTSGEQLIVRFLTAVTVAALALYVISDLRLQSEQDEPPVERNDSGSARTPAQAPAVMATVTGSHRRDQLGRRGRDAGAPPIPNFEAIETVTARSRTVVLADPTEAVTGSRLVPPAPGPSDRIVPPHPATGRTIENDPGREASWAPSRGFAGSDVEVVDAVDVVGETASEATEAAERAGDVANGVIDAAFGEAITERVDAVPEFLTPPDERTPAPPNASVIATTSFTYSGRLTANGVDWPPKPPTPIEPSEPVEPAVDDDPEVAVGAVDAPTGELPALTDLSSHHTYDDESLLAMFDAEINDGLDDASSGVERSSRRAHLFAVDTAEIFLTEPADEQPSVPNGADEPAAQPRPLIRRIEAADYAAPPRTGHLELRGADDTATAADVDRPLPAARPSEAGPSDKLTAAIRSGEIQVVNSLINQGMLSTSGPITDRDVRTMVYVAFTSNELRKLILAGGTPDGIRAGDLDLGEVELFDESRFAPTPKRLYAGPPAPSVASPETVLDLVALERESAVAAAPDSRDDHDLDDELVPTLPTPRHLYRRVDADRVEQ